MSVCPVFYQVPWNSEALVAVPYLCLVGLQQGWSARIQARPRAQQVEVKVGGKPKRSSKACEPETPYSKGKEVLAGGGETKGSVSWVRKIMLD